MSTVDHFIELLPDNQKEISNHLHQLLVNEYGLRPKIAYRIPFYYLNGRVCYLNPIKGGGIDFAFMRGIYLSNSDLILEQRDRKQICSVEIKKLTTPLLNGLHEIILEAILLDETQPKEPKRKKKNV